MEGLKSIRTMFEMIKEADESQEEKNIRLSGLMSYLERFYDIPLLERHTSQEKRESEEFKLYLEIAKARQWGGNV